MNAWGDSSHWANSSQQAEAAEKTTEAQNQGPSADVVQNGRGGGTVGESGASGWLYELQLAQPLPTIDISRTLLSSLLPSSMYAQAVRGMHRAISALVWLNRLGVLVFGFMLFSPADSMRAWMPLIGLVSLVPPLCFILFLSLEVLALLRRNYEYWFISVLSAMTWIGLGRMFGDSRAVACVSLWFSSFIVASIDANYRTYQSTAKSIVMGGPSVMLIVVCCAYKLIPDSSYPTESVGSLTLQSRQVVIFTASTLVIFMYKKAYLRVRRHRARSRNQEQLDLTGGRHTISCVVLQARMRLGPVIFERRHGLGTFARNHQATATNVQQLRLAPHRSVTVDARRILLSEKDFERWAGPQMQAALYFVATVGLASTAVAWMIVLYHADKQSLAIGVLAAASSLLFVLLTIALAQQDLLCLLLWNFDVLFSTFQATMLALCLLDLLRWDISSGLAVAAWWIWFHWILMLDALTPSITNQLQLRKLALPVTLLVLPIAAVCAVEILTGDGKIFTSRLLLSIRLPRIGTFDVDTETLTIQRIATIIGWNARLVLELALCDPAQLLFVRRPVEYTSPFLTFAEPLPTEGRTKRRGTERWDWRLPRSIAVVPVGASSSSDTQQQ